MSNNYFTKAGEAGFVFGRDDRFKRGIAVTGGRNFGVVEFFVMVFLLSSFRYISSPKFDCYIL